MNSLCKSHSEPNKSLYLPQNRFFRVGLLSFWIAQRYRELSDNSETFESQAKNRRNEQVLLHLIFFFFFFFIKKALRKYGPFTSALWTSSLFARDVQGPAGCRLLPTSPGLWQLDGFVSTCSPRLSFLRYAAESQVSSKLSAWLQPELSTFIIWSHPPRVLLSLPSPHLCTRGEQLGFGVFFF